MPDASLYTTPCGKGLLTEQGLGCMVDCAGCCEAARALDTCKDCLSCENFRLHGSVVELCDSGCDSCDRSRYGVDLQDGSRWICGRCPRCIDYRAVIMRAIQPGPPSEPPAGRSLEEEIVRLSAEAEAMAAEKRNWDRVLAQVAEIAQRMMAGGPA